MISMMPSDAFRNRCFHNLCIRKQSCYLYSSNTDAARVAEDGIDIVFLDQNATAGTYQVQVNITCASGNKISQAICL